MYAFVCMQTYMTRIQFVFLIGLLFGTIFLATNGHFFIMWRCDCTTQKRSGINLFNLRNSVIFSKISHTFVYFSFFFQLVFFSHLSFLSFLSDLIDQTSLFSHYNTTVCRQILERWSTDRDGDRATVAAIYSNNNNIIIVVTLNVYLGRLQDPRKSSSLSTAVTHYATVYCTF